MTFSLLNNSFAPVTYSWGFLRADHAMMTDALRERNEKAGLTTEIRRGMGELFVPLSFLNPLTTPITRQAVIQTDSLWTAIFHNALHRDAEDRSLDVVAQRLNCDYFSVQCQPDAVGFTLFGSRSGQTPTVIRSVRVFNEGTRLTPDWTFECEGEPLRFEDEPYYSPSPLLAALTPELLTDYAAALEIHLFQNSFYGGRYAVLIRETEAEEQGRTLPLKKRRKRLGLD